MMVVPFEAKQIHSVMQRGMTTMAILHVVLPTALAIQLADNCQLKRFTIEIVKVGLSYSKLSLT